MLAVCCHIKNKTYLRKCANLALTGPQILHIKTKKAAINVRRKINKRKHRKTNIKHFTNQIVGTIFNLYDKERNKKKIKSIVYNLKTSEENNSDQKLYKSLTKQITKKHRKKDNHFLSKVKKIK
jgi:hypothetical protein